MFDVVNRVTHGRIVLHVQLPLGRLVRCNVFFRRACSSFSRAAILAAAKTVHHDFGPFNDSLAVSLTLGNLEDIKTNPNVDWFEGDGRVIYCSIR